MCVCVCRGKTEVFPIVRINAIRNSYTNFDDSLGILLGKQT